MRKRLLAVQGPTQFLAGYIAMEWERESEGLEPMDTVVLSYDFLMTKSQENELADVNNRHKDHKYKRWKQSANTCFIESA